MDIKCEVCEKESEIDGDILPSFACDDTEWTCPHCESEMRIGWVAEIEVRAVTKAVGSNN